MEAVKLIIQLIVYKCILKNSSWQGQINKAQYFFSFIYYSTKHKILHSYSINGLGFHKIGHPSYSVCCLVSIDVWLTCSWNSQSWTILQRTSANKESTCAFNCTYIKITISWSISEIILLCMHMKFKIIVDLKRTSTEPLDCVWLCMHNHNKF